MADEFYDDYIEEFDDEVDEIEDDIEEIDTKKSDQIGGEHDDDNDDDNGDDDDNDDDDDKETGEEETGEETGKDEGEDEGEDEDENEDEDEDEGEGEEYEKYKGDKKIEIQKYIKRIYATKYEIACAVGFRANQLSKNGYTSLTKEEIGDLVDEIAIAELETKLNKSPIIIRRPFKDGFIDIPLNNMIK